MIEDGMKKKDHLYVLFLEAGVIESYLANLIIISGNPKNKLTSRSKKLLDNWSFSNMLALNQIIGNIVGPLYKELSEFGKDRNDFAHDMISFDFDQPEVKEKLKKVTNRGLEIFRQISDLYEDKRFALSMRENYERDQNER